MQQKEIFINEYNRLNEKQKEAVETLDGAVMVVAWPWTGKTQIIGMRTANIILKAWVNPENILITTFTDAWVIAIKERLVKFIGTEAYKVNVSTIHSFSDDVIKTFPEKFAYEKTEKAIDEIDQLEIIKNILKIMIDDGEIEELRAVGDDYFYLFDIKSSISQLKQEWIHISKFELLIDEEEKILFGQLEELRLNKRIRDLEKRMEKDKKEYEKRIKKLRELALLFKKYNEYLRNKGLYDFNDMINFVLDKFKEDEDLRYYYAEKFQYIMLDEYQDTNNAQNEIIALILRPDDSPDFKNPNIMVVGDDDQSIYRFQWANIENMLDFTYHYKEAKIIVLENNYRSHQYILDTASELIKNNNERLINKINALEKKLIAKSSFEDPESPKFYSAYNEIDEQNYVCENIKNLLSKGIKINEIALIVRQNKEVEVWSEFLKSQGIEVESKQKTNILNSDIIHLALDYLLLIANPYADDRKFIDLLLSSFIDIENIDVITLTRYLNTKNYVRKDKIALFDIIKNESLLQEIELGSREKIRVFNQKLLEFKSYLSQKTFIAFFEYFLQESQLLDYLDMYGTFNDLQDVFTLFNKIKDFSASNPYLSLETFLHKMDLYKTYRFPILRENLKTSRSWVQILTAHSSKWLEYEAVFIPWLVSWNWDNKKAITKIKLPSWIVWEGLQEEKEEKDEKSREEERRLFFVALTRAKSYLYFSAPKIIGNKARQRSLFVEEIKEYISEEQQREVSEETMKEVVKNIFSWPRLHTFSKPEIDYIEEFLKSYKLSPSELNVFLTDPKTFLHNMVFKYPFAPTEATIFWSIYHRVLELFYGKYIEKWKWEEKSYLTSTFSLLLKREILTPVEFERLEKKGLEWLSNYYETYKNNFWIPLQLEYNFKQRNIFFGDIPLTGKIDKIVKLSDFEPIFWQKASICVVDYKTGSIKSLGQIKGTDRYGNKKEEPQEWQYFRQLLFYKLLCELDTSFNAHYEVSDLMIDFVEWRNGEYKQLLVPFEPQEFEDFKILLADSREKIKNIEFWKEILEGK